MISIMDTLEPNIVEFEPHPLMAFIKHFTNGPKDMFPTTTYTVNDGNGIYNTHIGPKPKQDWDILQNS
jgi:hypothetical protein